MGSVRLSRTDPIGAGDHREMAGQAHGPDQGHGQIGALVGGDAQNGPARRQVIEGLDDAVESPALVGDMGDIVVNEMVEQFRLCGLVPHRPGLGKSMAEQGPGTMADQMPGRGHGHGRMAAWRQHPVQGADKVRCGVDQGAVQIEGYGPAFKIAYAHRHLPRTAGMG